MAGLLEQNQGMAPAQDAAPPQEPGAEAEAETNVSPEEQAQYEEFVDNAYKLLYGDDSMPAVLDRLKSSEDPIEAVANIAASTVMRLQDSASKAGTEISPDVLFHGGKEIVEDLADMASEAGIHDFTEQEMEAVWYQALDVYRNLAQGAGIDHTEAAAQDVAMLQEAEATGGVEEIFPELANRGGA